MVKEKQIVCRLPGEENAPLRWGVFSSPSEIIIAYRISDVISSLEKIEKRVNSGKYAAGFLSYESAPAFDEANVVNSPGNFPLLWFGVFDSEPEVFSSPTKKDYSREGVSVKPEIKESKYLDDVNKIKKYIEDGDIYQANFTFRSIASKIDDPYNLFLDLIHSHPVPYSAYVDTGDFQIVSLSPELFLRKQGMELLSIPMKGTAHRALTYESDKQAAADLSLDVKNRAENIMIVDMVRNDLGRICKTGSIKADPLFHVDTYSSVHQMVSEVRGTLDDGVSLPGIFKAAFPAASITGAPKIRAMEIIKELEESPRKVYTGTIGCITPESNFCFNVAIRTLICSENESELGIGSGIVADSVPEDEYQESLLKSKFLSNPVPEFEMLETMLLKNGEIVLIEEHLERLRTSQFYFGRKWDGDEVSIILKEEVQNNKESADLAKVRLLLDRDSKVKVEVSKLESEGWGKDELKIKISKDRVDSSNFFFYHKTTNREFYNSHFKEAMNEGLDEIIFLNERGEVTEGAISNIFICRNGKWATPHLSCGLLPGVWRAKLIEELDTEELILFPTDLENADEIMLCNSVRGEAKAIVN